MSEERLMAEVPENEPTVDPVDGSDMSEEECEGKLHTRWRFTGEVFDFLEMLVIAACAIMLIFTFVARISSVEGSSMINTLEDGDKLVVSNLFYTPAQGDIVVFQDLDTTHTSAVVKRIIATGGQTVQLVYVPDEQGINRMLVYVDGMFLEEEYRYYDTSLPDLLQHRYQGVYTYEVPEGSVFVLGDNTYNSEDSRGDFGCVDTDKIIGRVVFRLAGKDLSDLFNKIGPVA